MDERRENQLIEDDTVRDIEAAMRRILPDAKFEIRAWTFDGVVEIRHERDEKLDDDVPARIAEALRGGPIDMSRSSDWHVRSVGPILGPVGNSHLPVGTAISLVRSLRPPSGYDEAAMSWTR